MPFTSLRLQSATPGAFTLAVSVLSIASMLFFPDHGMLPTKKTPAAASDGAAPAAARPRAKCVVIVLMVANFFGTLDAFLVEAITALIFNETYGWGPSDLASVYAVLGVGYVASGAANVSLQKHVAARKLAVFTFVSPFVAASLMVHVGDFSTALPAPFVLAGMVVGGAALIMSSTIVTDALTRNLEPDEVVKGLSLYQTMQQLARLVAPLAGVTVYSGGKSAGTAGYGANACFATQRLLQLGVQLLLALNFAEVYGMPSANNNNCDMI
jgi:predicted MFS family arabinose efflux permease